MERWLICHLFFISSLGNEKYVRFSLKDFEKYCFKEVHTYTDKEFNQYLDSLDM